MTLNPRLPKFFYINAYIVAFIKLFIAWFSKDTIEDHPLLWDISTYLVYVLVGIGFIINLLLNKRK